MHDVSSEWERVERWYTFTITTVQRNRGFNSLSGKSLILLASSRPQSLGNQDGHTVEGFSVIHHTHVDEVRWAMVSLTYESAIFGMNHQMVMRINCSQVKQGCSSSLVVKKVIAVMEGEVKMVGVWAFSYQPDFDSYYRLTISPTASNI